MINTIVSAIIQKQTSEGKFILIQTRWKKTVSPLYSGLLEIPAGCIDDHETVYQALTREVKEETGLKVEKIINDYQSEINTVLNGEKSFVFQPAVCQQVFQTQDTCSWIGFVFICEVSGEKLLHSNEAKDIHWVKISTLKTMLKEQPNSFFPIQLAALKWYTALNNEN